MELRQYVYSLLSQVGSTVFAYPHQWEQFPMISFYQRDGGLKMAFGGQERLVRYSFQVDLWDKSETPQQIDVLAQSVSQAMVDGGFTRFFTADIPDKPGFFHKAMRFGCTLDTQTGALYSRNN